MDEAGSAGGSGDVQSYLDRHRITSLFEVSWILIKLVAMLAMHHGLSILLGAELDV